MRRYIYDGPVMAFGEITRNRWKGETLAASPAKAKSNLAYQYKRETRRRPDCYITLPGSVKTADGKGT